MRAKRSARRYIAWALAALVSIPLSLSGLWVESQKAEASAPEIDYSVKVSSGVLRVADPGTNSALDAGATKTIEAWIKLDSTPSYSSDYVILTKEHQYAITLNNGKIVYYTGNSVNQTWTNPRTGQLNMTAGEWYHIALVFTSGRSHLFINGSQITLSVDGVISNDAPYSANDASYLTTGADPSANDFGIGSWVNGASRFPGQIDQVKLWNADRRSTLTADMHAWQSSDTTLPVAHWDFNAGTGSTVEDKIGALDLSNPTSSSLFYTDVKTETFSAGKKVVTFPRSYLTSTGGWTIPTGLSIADVLIVGGGGGGGSRHAGGGGAGALLYQESTPLSGTLKVQVGQGGRGNVAITNHNGQLAGGSGQSTFLGITELKGGGGGAGAAGAAQAGGSGGGVSGPSDPPAQATGSGLFNRGGRGDGNAAGNYAGGGGGGAQSAGSNASRPAAGAGGSGYVSDISGSLKCYAAGGGGGSETNVSGSTGGAAGSGGACTSGQVSATVSTSAGAGSRGNAVALSAAPNSGSGGGGGGYHTTNLLSGESGFGGSGVVIVAYAPTEDKFLDFSSTSANLGNSGYGVPAEASFTVEAWVRSDANEARNNIFSQRDLSGGQLGEFNFQTHNGTVLVGIRTGIGPIFDTGYTMPLNEWVHVAATVERGASTSVVKFYVNGYLRSTSSAINNITLTPEFRIGRIYADHGGTESWKGDLDQVKVWNGALDASEITASMHAHHSVSVGAGKSLRAHWDFNDSNNVGQELTGTYSLTVSNGTPVLTDLVSPTVANGKKLFKFDRSYLTAWGGWTAPAGTATRYSAVVVGGGGGGGAWVGGGGGGGGVTQSLNRTYNQELASVIVGQGGRETWRGYPNYTYLATNGQGSSFGGVISVSGGGAGGSHIPASGSWGITSETAKPTNGASGGGATGAIAGLTTGGTGISGEGFAGGNGSSSSFYAGGGGGAGGLGGNATSQGGTGGIGSLVPASVAGSATYYGGGGGGSNFMNLTNSTPNQGAGGLGGGGNAGSPDAVGGTRNTGGGGGGAAAGEFSASRGGVGGSGVVLLYFDILPDAPISVTATSGSLVGLSWTPPVYTGEGSITDYVVQYRVSPNGTWTTFNDGVSTSTSTNVTGLDTCKKYDFQVAAKNSFGNSVYSSSASAIVGVGTFSSVVGVTPTTTATRCVLNFTEVGATTWTPPSGTATADLMAVGGGAGGRADGGGGGGGGSAQHSSGVNIADKTFTMTVGAGGPSDTAGSDSTISASGITFTAKGGSIGGAWVSRTSGAAGASGAGGTYLVGGAGGAGPAEALHNQPGASDGSPGLTSPITGSLFTKYGGGGGGGASSHRDSATYPNKTELISPKLGVDGGGNGGGVGPQSALYICSGKNGNSAYYGASTGQPGTPGTGGGGGAGVAWGDECEGEQDTGNDGERTDGGAGGSGAIVVSFLKPGQVALASSAICDGTSTQNTLTVEAGHGEVFYIDTGQGQEIDAAYIAYKVKSVSARSDLWVEVTGFTGGSVTLANNNDSALPLGSVAGNGSKTAFFMVKAKNATTTAQSHVVNVYDSKPTIGDPTPIYTCNYTFTAVEETIKAAANKVNSVTTSSVAQLGATMTITVDGDSGTIGQGNDIDGRMIWLTPAARSNWPTGALRLESTTLTMFSNSQRTSVLSTHSDTLRINATTSPALSGNNRQYYRAVYTFRVIGPAAATAPIIPVAMISSGTQIKHTDVSGISGGTVDIRTPVVNLAVTKNVSPTTTVNADGTTTFDYTVSLVNSGTQTLVIDEVIDSPDTALTYRSGSAKFNGSLIEDPGIVGTSQLGFSGPLSLPANSTRTITYKMVGETCAVGATYEYSNTATARSGTVVIGSGSATQSVVDIRGNCGEPQAVVEVKNEPIPPSATTTAATSVGTTTATINGLVDPNGEPGLNIRFIYSTSPTLASTTAVTRDNSTASANGYAVSAPLTGLTAGTTYYYRVEIKDKAGNWVQGEIMSFTTSPAPANPTAQTDPVTEISETTARFNGSIDANLVSGGAKVTYEWGIANNDGTCTAPAPTSIQATGFLQSEGESGPEDAVLTGANSTSMTFEATGLTPGAKYCVRINGHYGTGFNTKVSGSWVPFTMAAKQPQTISFSPSIAILPAGGSTTVNAGSTSGLDVVYTSTDTSICTVNSSTGVVTAVATSGVCSITATQAGNNSYYAATPKTVSFEISPPVITTLQSEISSGTYRSAYTEQLDATGGNGTYTTWTISRDSLPPGLSLNPTTGAITGTPTAAGIYTFSVTTTSNGIVSEPKIYTITIAKVVVTVTASNETVTFGAAVPTVEPSYSGFVGGDSSTVLNSSPNIKPTCSTNYVVGDNAGTSTRTTSCSGAWSENYTFTYVAGTVTINKLAITVTALDAVKQNLYTNSEATVRSDPSFIGKFSFSPQLPAGQTLSDAIPGGVAVSRTNTASTTFDALGITWPTGEAPGTYAITPSGVSSSTNYNITYVPGVFTIQTPKAVPQLFSTDKVIDFGSNPASALSITVSSTCSPDTGTTTFQFFNGSIWASITDVSILNAGVYTIKARFVPNDTSDCYGRDSEVLETSYQLTVQKATATITASTSQKWVGDPDPTFTWTVAGLIGLTTSADIGRVNLVRTTGEEPGSYNVTPSGASHPNYNFNYVAGKLYIGKILINTTDQGGVLTNRNVTLTCAGLKPGATIELKLTTPDQALATGTVAADGTCPVTAVIPSNVLGNFQLETQSKFPTEVVIQSSRPVSLVADPPAPVTEQQNPPGNSGGGGAPAPSVSPTPSPTPSIATTPTPIPTRGNPPSRPNPGNPQAQRPQLPTSSPTPAPSQAPPGQNVARPSTQADPLAEPPLAAPPRLPGRVVPATPVTPPSAGENQSTPSEPALERATVDTGSGVKDVDEVVASGSGLGESTRQQGVRTVDELASERLSGFAPGAGLRIEILGARTGARFVLADLQAVDAVALIRAMEASIPTQAADFSKITRVVRGERPLIQEQWEPEVREGINEFFEAVGLQAPRALIDLDLTGVRNWVSVSAEVETYQPGSTVFLVATSSPIVLATAEVDQNGRAQLSGAMPVEALGAGEHRVRVVGIRSLDGVSVDDQGEIQLSAELLEEIQRFDLGTQSTIALSGLNPEGGYHSAIRVVPLIPVAPWWTLWFILGGLVLALGARYRRLLDTPTRRIIAASGVVASSLPAVIIGWVSTVTNVVWVGILLGLVGAAASWFMPEQKQAARRK